MSVGGVPFITDSIFRRNRVSTGLYQLSRRCHRAKEDRARVGLLGALVESVQSVRRNLSRYGAVPQADKPP